MTPDKNIVNELNELAPMLVGLQQKLPYSVPVGYFDDFAEQMLIKLGSAGADEEIAALSPLLAGLSRKMPYTLPAEYFEQSPVIVPDPGKELDASSPLLNVSKTGPYTVPPTYFELLPDQVMKNIADQNKQSARIVTMGRNWLKYAAAAVIAGAIAIGGWFYTRPSSGSADLSVAIAKQLETEMAQISDEAILEYENPTSTFYYGMASLQPEDMTGIEVHDLLGDVSDEALQQYIQENNGKIASSIN